MYPRDPGWKAPGTTQDAAQAITGELVPWAITFDYGAISPADATGLRAKAVKVREMVQKTMSAIVEVGNELLDAKHKLNHGHFKSWIEAECGFSHSAALNYMRVAEFAKTKNATVALLAPRTVYKLAAPSTPAALADEIESRVAAGEQISHKQVLDALDDALNRRRNEELDRQRAERLSRMPKKKRQQIEADRLARIEQQQEENERRSRVASSIIERFGVDGAKFIVDAFGGGFSWDILDQLRQQIGGKQ
jgi:hypothetical protein